MKKGRSTGLDARCVNFPRWITSTSKKPCPLSIDYRFLSWDGSKSSELNVRNRVLNKVIKFFENELTSDPFVYNSGSYRQTTKLLTMPQPCAETEGVICGLGAKPFFSFLLFILPGEKSSLTSLELDIIFLLVRLCKALYLVSVKLECIAVFVCFVS